MPYKIQGIDGKAGKKQKQHSAIYHLLPEPNLPASQIEEEKHQDCHATVNIGPVVQSNFHIYISYMSGKHIKNRKIGTDCFRKIKFSRGSHLKGIDLRKEHHCRQSSCHQRIKSKLSDIYCIILKFLSLSTFQNQKSSKIYHQKNTYHNRNVIVGKNTYTKTNTVKHSLSFLNQPLQPQHNDRKQKNAVQPHDIPAIGRHVA